MSCSRWLAAAACALLVPAFTSSPVMAAPTTTSIAIGQAPPDSLDPALTSTQAGWDISNQMFSGLTRWDRRAATLSLDLASSYSASTDLKTWTFTLSSKAHWSDGKPITAGDEVFALERALNPATGPDQGFRSILAGLVSGVSATGRSTVQFQLTQPAAYFPAVVSLPITHPVPQAVVTQFGAAWLDPANIVVSGAYTLASTSPTQTVLVANKRARVHPVIDQVTYDTGDPSQFAAAFRSGALDYVDPFTIGGTLGVESDPSLAPHLTITGPDALTEHLIFNAAYGSTANFDVRHALSAATDRSGLSAAVNGPTNFPATTFTAPGEFGAVPPSAGVGITYDPSAARAAATSAGSAFPSSVTLRYPCNGRRQQEADFLKSNWESVFGSGFTVNEQCGPPGQVISSLFNPDPSGQADVTIIAWSADYPDANDWLAGGATSVSNRWSDPDYSADLADAAATLDSARRQADYTDAEDILLDRVAGIATLYYRPAAYLARARLTVSGSYLENWTAV